MPGIYMFKRYWAIGTDDFVFPSFMELCLRFSWLLTISILFAIHNGSFNCDNGYLLRDYYMGTIVILSVTIVHTFVTMVVSMRGSIRDCRPREQLIKLLYLKFLMILPETVWVFLSTYWAFGHSFDCNWSVYWAARGAVICAWIVGFWMFIGLLFVFDPLGSAEHRVKVGDTMAKSGREFLIGSSKSQNMRVWENRCRCICCCIAHSQDNDEAFSDVSKLVADFFKDIDLVPTDIAAGLMLVEQQQKYGESSLPTVVIQNTPTAQLVGSGEAAAAEPLVMTEDGSSPQRWMTISLMTHYMKFALGSYGWPFFVYSNFFTGLCKLGSSCRCCSCIRADNQVTSDNICECHTAAIKQLTKIKDHDLIYVSFHNKYRELPFYVAVDRKYNNVVVSIRGTLSLQDALTDLSAKGETFEIEGVPGTTFHSAMLDCAKYIKSQLEQKLLLEKAFSSLQGDSQLVIVGHSLGAGVAAILAVLLRPQYNSLACFAYSPPGGLMSPSASLYARSFVCSVIVGEDVVPRLGMPTMCDLKIKVLRSLCQCSKPKYRILATGCFRMLCSCLLSSDSISGLNCGETAQLTDSQPRRYSTYDTPIQDALKSAEEYAQEMMQMDWPMHPPGRILHIIEQEESRFCSGGPQYTAVWAQPDDFNTIIISHKMILDHFPDVVLRALTQLEEKNFAPLAHRVSVQSYCC